MSPNMAWMKRMVVAVALSLPVHAEGKPTTRPATMPLDVTTPEEAARSFIRALNTVDMTSALKTVTDTPGSKELVGLTIEVGLARWSLREAIAERYPPEEWRGAVKVLMEADFIDFDVVKARRVDESGRVLLSNRNPDAPLILMKVGDEWRVDFEHCLLFDKRANVDQGLYREQNKLIRDEFTAMAARLRSGEFKNMTEFKKAAFIWFTGLPVRVDALKHPATLPNSK